MYINLNNSVKIKSKNELGISTVISINQMTSHKAVVKFIHIFTFHNIKLHYIFFFLHNITFSK